MTRTLIRLLLLASFSLIPPSVAAEARTVLVIFSNNRLLPSNIEVDRGFRETIAAATTRNVEFFAEFLDRPTFTGQAYEQTVATYLREKYATRPPEVIVVVTRPALDFLLRHRERLFPGVPVVHAGVDKSFVEAHSPMPADVVGAPVTYHFLATIQLALRWHPNTRRLVLVTGTSVTDRLWEAELRADLGRLETGAAVELLTGLSTDEVVKRLAALGDGDVVFTPGYFRDGANREFVPRDSVALMAAASGAPVYGPFSTYIGTGLVGGLMTTPAEMGRQAAKTVIDLLGGASPAALRMPAIIPAVVEIDWRQARKWGIGSDAIPADAIVHFKKPTFWEQYRNEAIAIVTVILLQAALIGALLVERRLRRRTALALEASEKQMNLASHAARLRTLIWDVSRDKIRAGTTLRQRAGLSKEVPIHLDEVLQTVHPADRESLASAVRLAVEKGEELDVEYRTQHEPDSKVRWVAVRGRGEKGDGEHVMGIALDITERKEAELQAEKDRSALTHMTRVSMMGQLSASIAHQLNQPLAAILGNAEAARKMLERESLDLVELKEICDDIVAQDNRAAEVIRRLGALYKRGEMKLALLDLNELVREQLDLVRTELIVRHVTTVTELAPSLPAIDGGRVQLQQVLLNLILNAADAMSETEATERNLMVRTERDGAFVRLYVIDHGTGIAPEDIKHVFDAFWSTKAGGIGIGLAICQSIVTAHRGTLTVANNPDGGATFCVTLPAPQRT